MRKHSGVLVLGAGLLGMTRVGAAGGCGELHYARLSGSGFLAYRCFDESCWLKKHPVSESPILLAAGDCEGFALRRLRWS